MVFTRELMEVDEDEILRELDAKTHIVLCNSVEGKFSGDTNFLNLSLKIILPPKSEICIHICIIICNFAIIFK